MKPFTAIIYVFLFLSLASLSSLVKCLQVRPEPTRVKCFNVEFINVISKVIKSKAFISIVIVSNFWPNICHASIFNEDVLCENRACIYSFSFSLQFIVEPSGMAFSLSLSLPLLIGSIPINQYQPPMQPLQEPTAPPPTWMPNPVSCQ